jgi:hypothetical protein
MRRNLSRPEVTFPSQKLRGDAVNHIPQIHDLERTHGVTWGELVGQEPRLNELLWQARAAGAGCRCREHVERAFAPFRSAAAELVGFMSNNSRHPVLGSVGAYEVIYWRLYNAVSGLVHRPTDVREAQNAPAETAPEERLARVA